MEETVILVRPIAGKVGASMKAAKAVLVGVLLFAAADLIASGPVGFYGIIEKVVFEPSEWSATCPDCRRRERSLPYRMPTEASGGTHHYRGRQCPDAAGRARTPGATRT